jgi:chromosome segregation ATPase
MTGYAITEAEEKLESAKTAAYLADVDLDVAGRNLASIAGNVFGQSTEEDIKAAEERLEAAQKAFDEAKAAYDEATTALEDVKAAHTAAVEAKDAKKAEIATQEQVVEDLDNDITGQWIYYVHDGKPVYDIYTEQYEAIKPELDEAGSRVAEAGTNLEIAGKNLANAKLVKDDADTAIATEKQNYENVVGASKGFKESQEKKAEAENLVDRAAAAFEKTTNAYNEIKTLYNNEVQKRAEAEKYHKETESKLEAAVKYTLKVNPMARMTLRAFKIDYTDENLLHIAAHRVTTNGSKDEVSQLISTLSVGRFNGNTVNKVIKLLGY